jgi:hypothetical protein
MASTYVVDWELELTTGRSVTSQEPQGGLGSERQSSPSPVPVPPKRDKDSQYRTSVQPKAEVPSPSHFFG